MSIDRSRLTNYLQEMRGLEERVSETNFIKRFKAKLLDLFARNQIDTDDLEFIRKQVKLLFKAEFAGFDNEIRKTYHDVLDVVNDMYDDIGPNISEQFEKVQAVRQTNQLQLENYKQSTIEGIARAVREGVRDDLNVRDLEAKISDVGRMARDYAETLSRTQVKRFARISKYNKSLIADVEYYEYAGILHDTIRPFCYACLHHIFSINQLVKMKNGNLEPVIINCGGWRCIHDLEPDPTATSDDAVSGKLYSLRNGAKIYGDEGIAKQFSYSFGLDGLVNRKGIQQYIDKTRKISITDRRVRHIRKHYPDLSDKGIRAKVGQIRQNPDRVYYQYNKGPGMVYEKNGEFVFISARKVKTMMGFSGDDLDKFREHQVKYFRRLRNYE